MKGLVWFYFLLVSFSFFHHQKRSRVAFLLSFGENVGF